MLYQQSQRATGVSHRMWGKELFGGGLCWLSAFLFITVETATSESWILNVGQARQFQCFSSCTTGKSLYCLLSQDFVHWLCLLLCPVEFLHMKKKSRIEMNPHPHHPRCWRRWTPSVLETQQNIWNSPTMYKKKDVCLLFCSGACWDVAEDDCVVIWPWTPADGGSQYTSLIAEPKVLLPTRIPVTPECFLSSQGGERTWGGTYSLFGRWWGSQAGAQDSRLSSWGHCCDAFNDSAKAAKRFICII